MGYVEYTDTWEYPQASGLASIGEPCKLSSLIDPDHEISKFLKRKMNRIDIYPCSFNINFRMEKGGSTSGYYPQIRYTFDEYSATCVGHGLPPAFGIRLYGTDDTIATDTFSNKTKENFLQGINKLADKSRSLRDFVMSVDERAATGFTEISSNVIDYLTGKFGTAGAAVGSVGDTLVKILAEGHRIALPNIWSNSQYSPSFTTNVKLVSPYGHPNAIKEFIIKPLLYLLILSTPETEDGVSYGRPTPVMVRGYGLGDIPLGMIENVSLQRGGDNSSFNAFHQPLTINASIQFANLVPEFAHYKDGENEFSRASAPTWGPQVHEKSLTTITEIVSSLRPCTPDIHYPTTDIKGRPGSIPASIYKTDSILDDVFAGGDKPI